MSDSDRKVDPYSFSTFAPFFGPGTPTSTFFSMDSSQISGQGETARMLAKFSTERLRADMMAAQSIMLSRTPQDALAAWAGAASKAMRDYADLLDQFVEINRRSVGRADEV